MKENNELERTDIAVDSDMEVDCDIGQEITAYIETWFDVDKKFGIDTAADNGTWLNTTPLPTPCVSNARSAATAAPRILTMSRQKTNRSS